VLKQLTVEKGFKTIIQFLVSTDLRQDLSFFHLLESSLSSELADLRLDGESWLTR
jgi:hypothetical protein